MCVCWCPPVLDFITLPAPHQVRTAHRKGVRHHSPRLEDPPPLSLPLLPVLPPLSLGFISAAQRALETPATTSTPTLPCTTTLFRTCLSSCCDQSSTFSSSSSSDDNDDDNGRSNHHRRGVQLGFFYYYYWYCNHEHSFIWMVGGISNDDATTAAQPKTSSEKVLTPVPPRLHDAGILVLFSFFHVFVFFNLVFSGAGVRLSFVYVVDVKMSCDPCNKNKQTKKKP